MDGNYLTAIPSVASLSHLRVLSANDNLITALPPGLAACTRLEVLSLERNRISTPIADLRPLQRLHTLGLGGAHSCPPSLAKLRRVCRTANTESDPKQLSATCDSLFHVARVS